MITLLVPCRDEAASLPGLFESLDRLDYPRDRLRVIIVDDGSTDRSAPLAQAWAKGQPWVRVLSTQRNVGKAAALNLALEASAQPGSGGGAEVVAIYDADHRPDPAALRVLAAPFANPHVAGASGQMRVTNGSASPAAFYAMTESLVHQLVTMRAKDRLSLAPALLGANCAYRRTALEAAGGFRGGALLEDSDLTLAFALAGWRTRFVPESVSAHHAPTTLAGYIQQHLRWNRGFHQVIGSRLREVWASPRLSLLLKLELTVFALGYADRLALLAGALFTAVDQVRPGTFGFPAWVWAAYFGVPALEMAAALALAREPAAAFLRLAYVPFFFVFDIGIALWASLASLARRPLKWGVTERPQTRLIDEAINRRSGP